jgi:hypothetical protein
MVMKVSDTVSKSAHIRRMLKVRTLGVLKSIQDKLETGELVVVTSEFQHSVTPRGEDVLKVELLLKCADIQVLSEEIKR